MFVVVGHKDLKEQMRGASERMLQKGARTCSLQKTHVFAAFGRLWVLKRDNRREQSILLSL